MVDYVNTTPGSLPPYLSALAVSPNDGTDLSPPTGNARPTRGLFVGGAGTLNVDMADGGTVSFTIPATATGYVLEIAVKRVRATGTTATLIVALW